MRSATAPELAVLAGLTRTVTRRLKVANGSGTMIDLSSWVEHISPDEDIDQPVSGMTIEFTRANGVLQTLAPLRTDSTLNVKDDLTYSPQVDLARRVTYEVATTAYGVLPVAGDYKLLFDGTTSVVNFAGSPIVVTCRDKGATLVDRFVETPKLYGSAPGVAVETVMQSIHDDVLGAGVVPVYTPTSPGYLISPAYQQQIQSIMDADVALAQNPGWDVRYRWDNGTSAFRFTFKEPGRAKTIPDYTFGPSAYFDVTKLELAETDIRNVVIVSYRDSADLGNRKTITVTDGPSITKYGRKPLVIIEGDASPIDTLAEATTLANAALADLKDPKADMEITLPFFWPCELGDLYRFSANGVHFNTDQDLAVVSFTHDLSLGRHETRIRVRGTPAGQYITWLGRGQTIGGGGAGAVAKPPYPYIAPLNTEANELTWNLRFNALSGSGGGGVNLTYTVKRKKDFASETTLSSGNASAFPLDLSVTRDPKQNAVLTLRVTDAATGLFAEATWPVPSYDPFVDATGLGFTSGATESGGKAINRIFAKALAADPDTLDSAADGTTYKKVTGVVSNLITPSSSTGRFRCKAYLGANQTLTNGTITAINFGSEVFDTGALHDTGSNTNRITIPSGGDVGVWFFTAQLGFDVHATGMRTITIRDQAGADAANCRVSAVSSVLGPILQVTAFVNAPAVGNWYEVRGTQTSGGDLDVIAGLAVSYFAAIHLW